MTPFRAAIFFRRFMLIGIVIAAPFAIICLLALADVLREMIYASLWGENPIEVLRVSYTSNKLGFSKNLVLANWPPLIFEFCCLLLQFKVRVCKQINIVALSSVTAFLIPLIAYIYGYPLSVRSFIVVIACFAVLWVAVLINTSCSRKQENG